MSLDGSSPAFIDLCKKVMFEQPESAPEYRPVLDYACEWEENYILSHRDRVEIEIFRKKTVCLEHAYLLTDSIYAYNDIKICFNFVDGELVPIRFVDKVCIGDNILLFDVSKRDNGKYEYIYNDTEHFIVIEDRDPAAVSRPIPVQVLNYKHEFPGTWFNEPLNSALHKKICDACKEFNSAQMLIITRYPDGIIKISNTNKEHVLIRKKPDGKTVYIVKFNEDNLRKINGDYGKLLYAVQDLLAGYI